MNKRRYEGEQTKTNIINQAKTLFSSKGYSSTSIQDICTAAGVSKGNLYYHFSSKEELFLHIEEENCIQWWNHVNEIISRPDSFADKLYALGDFYAGYERPFYSAEREFINSVGLDSEAGQKFVSVLSRYRDNFQQFAEAGIASGALKDRGVHDLTFIISSYFAAMNHYSYFYVTDKDSCTALFRKAANLLLYGLSTVPEEP